MISKKRNKEKGTRPNPATESKLAAIARSFKGKLQLLKASEPKANAKEQHEGTNAEGFAHDALSSGPSTHHTPTTNWNPQRISGAAIARSFKGKLQLLKASEPKANAKEQHEGTNAEGFAHDALSSGPSTHHTPTTNWNPQRISGSQVIQTRGSHNWSHVGDDNRYNKGTIVRVTGGSAHIYAKERSPSPSPSFKFGFMNIAVIFMEATQQVLHDLFGNVATNFTPEFENNSSEGNLVGERFGRLIESIKFVMEMDEPSVTQALLNHLGDLWSELSQQSFAAADDPIAAETLSRDITCKVRLFLFVIHMAGHIPTTRLAEMVKKRITAVRRHAEPQAAKDLPSARAAYDDYVSSSHTRVSCLEGTRQALLDEVAEWVANSEAGIFVLFGLAGIGKSTIAQTVAERADDVQLLGASFFFSRYESERRTAERFFTTIASQLCVHDTEFAEAISSIVRTDPGRGATGKRPLDQLEELILEPLRNLARRTVVIVIDALDECDECEGPVILQGLNRLVQCLPSFKIILTTRPQPHLQFHLDGQTSQKIFHLHDIEEKIVDGDIEFYLRHKLSLEGVKSRLPNLRNPWNASDEDIKSLVHGAGRLFIIASTAVLFLLDKTNTPASRMKILRKELDQDHMRSSLNTLNEFYTVILRNAVPKDCKPDTVDLYQTVIGSIVLLQERLPVSSLAKLIHVEVDEITTVLGNLRAVIVLGNDDIPVVYHKSFPDYIQDQAHCKDEDLRIDPTFHHTRMTVQCLRLSNRSLKQNIMDLGDPARFMDNDKALETQGLTKGHVQEKIPSELKYACLYLGNHIQSADEDADLAAELERFSYERFLNWLEALSWIEKLNSAPRILLILQKKKLKSTSSDLHQLLTDGQRFVSKFYELISQSALHTYHSALPLTPTETSLYMRYSKQMTFCRVQGGQKMWDAVVTKSNVTIGGFNSVNHVIFSQNSSLFACFITNWRTGGGHMAIHDAATGIPFGKIEGRVFTIANDFSKVVAFNDGSIALYNIKGAIPVAIIKLSATVLKLALCPDGSQIVALLDDGTIGLWDTEKCEQIKSLCQLEKKSQVVFSSDASRIAFATCDEVIKLLDGTSGKTIADLRFPGLEEPRLKFSLDGSRLACLVVRKAGKSTLSVWNSQDGTLIGTAEDVGNMMAISTDGSLVATRSRTTVKLWSGNDLTLLENPSLDLQPNSRISCLAIRNDLLGIAFSGLVALYDINNHVFIARLPFGDAAALAFSPDSSRLAAGNNRGEVQLWDVRSIVASNFTSQGESSKPTRLTFSPDCSRLASSHEDGTIKLWNTSNMAQVSAHKVHSKRVAALEFSIDGGKFASGAADGIHLWNGKDGAPVGVLDCSVDEEAPVALSSSVLAIATEASIILWDLKTHSVVTTLDQHDTSRLAFSHHHQLLAVAICTREDNQDYRHKVMVWDIEKPTPINTFNFDPVTYSWKMRFLLDDSQLAIQCMDDSFHLFNLHDGRQSTVSETQAICRLGLRPSWHGIPLWANNYEIRGQFPQQEKAGLVLNLKYSGGSLQPVEAMAEGSYMIALGCADGRILLIRAV